MIQRLRETYAELPEQLACAGEISSTYFRRVNYPSGVSMLALRGVIVAGLVHEGRTGADKACLGRFFEQIAADVGIGHYRRGNSLYNLYSHFV